jgi:putative acetyltransferase
MPATATTMQTRRLVAANRRVNPLAIRQACPSQEPLQPVAWLWTTFVGVIEPVGWDHPDAVALREARQREIAETYGRDDSEPAGSAVTGPDVAVFLVAYDGRRAVGCGGLRIIGDGVGEVKRMYVDSAKRGTGVSTALLKALETWAIEHQLRSLRLETGDLLVAAQRFYEREGFTSIPPFGPYVGSTLSRCYERQVVPGHDEGTPDPGSSNQ